MKTYKIAVIPGDGIGPEVIEEGVKVLRYIEKADASVKFDCTFFPWGTEYYLEHGKMMPDDGIEILRPYAAVYLGAVGDVRVPDHITLWGLLLKIRKSFHQYVNLRPVKLLEGAPGVLNGKTGKEIDMLIIRENSEGEYSGAGDWLFAGEEREMVLQTGIFTRKGTERIIRYAFETARRMKKTVTSISKGNALNYSMVFWDQIFEEVAEEYPDVKTQSLLVDAACMLAVKKPEIFQVVVTSNLFGDIFSDLGAAIGGGMGFAAGANINPEKEYPSMFEPVHGSAPDIAGKKIANPLAAIWSVSQMLEFLGEEKWAEKVLKAIEELVKEGTCLTPDLGGSSSTGQVGDRIVEILKQ